MIIIKRYVSLIFSDVPWEVQALAHVSQIRMIYRKNQKCSSVQDPQIPLVPAYQR